ncbi:MAG TPA: hypothetical protein PKE45_07910, partial [Caldilineaceae bacterium]|nr:hypothetical protein [Caldilineaceae bacterium]
MTREMMTFPAPTPCFVRAWRAKDREIKKLRVVAQIDLERHNRARFLVTLLRQRCPQQGKGQADLLGIHG